MNESGIYPVGNRVLVLPDVIEEKTEGGIFIPDQISERHGMAQTLGILVDLGADSFDGYKENFATPGDRVCFAKYGGLSVRGKDGKQYRIINDVDITAKVDEEVVFDDISSRKKLEGIM